MEMPAITALSRVGRLDRLKHIVFVVAGHAFSETALKLSPGDDVLKIVLRNT